MLVFSCFVAREFTFHVLLEDDTKQKTHNTSLSSILWYLLLLLEESIIPPGLIKFRKTVARGDNFQTGDVWNSSHVCLC